MFLQQKTLLDLNQTNYFHSILTELGWCICNYSHFDLLVGKGLTMGPSETWLEAETVHR